jgi:serine/threonine protein kinase
MNNDMNEFAELRGLKEQFPDVQPISKIGEGGVCSVFLVFNTTQHRQEVLKIMHERIVLLARQHDREQEIVERFRQECQLVVRLHEKGIERIPKTYLRISLNDPEHKNKVVRPGMLMQYIPGKNLREIASGINRKPDGWIAATALLCQASELLMQLHQAGVVHGDFTPDNTVLDSNGTVWILDLGIARVLADDLPKLIQIEKPVFGKEGFMAPELVTGDQLMTYQSDMFTLAQFTVFMFTEKIASPGDSLDTFREQKRIPEQLGSLCAKALQRDSEARPTVEEFHQAVVSAWNGINTGKTPQKFLALWQTNTMGNGTIMLPDNDSDCDVTKPVSSQNIPFEPEKPEPASGSSEKEKPDDKTKIKKTFRKPIVVGTGVVVGVIILVLAFRMNGRDRMNTEKEPVTGIIERHITEGDSRSLSDRVLTVAEAGDLDRAAMILSDEEVEDDDYLARLIKAAKSHQSLRQPVY